MAAFQLSHLPSSVRLCFHEKKLTKLETKAFSLPLPRLRAPRPNRHLVNERAPRCILALRRGYSNNLLPTSPLRRAPSCSAGGDGHGYQQGRLALQGQQDSEWSLDQTHLQWFSIAKGRPGDGEGVCRFVGLSICFFQQSCQSRSRVWKTISESWSSGLDMHPPAEPPLSSLPPVSLSFFRDTVQQAAGACLISAVRHLSVSATSWCR